MVNDEQITPDSDDSTASTAATPSDSSASPQLSTAPKSHKRLWIMLFFIAVIAALVAGFWLGHQHAAAPTKSSLNTAVNKPATQAATPNSSAPGLQLDPNKNYGNKYADGTVPVGDNKYTSSGPKQGYVYTCSQYAHNLAADSGGAGVRGPWFSSDHTTYNYKQKIHVGGSVMWQAKFTDTLNGSSRLITTNDLPANDPTGIFPIMRSDPAYAYDKNPNSITGQNFTYTLSANPTYGNPGCMGGEAGIMLTGVALFNALDAGGRDAGAWEIQDNCDGHPQKDGIYHYHTLSSCIKDTSVKTVIGFALDGFPITGPQVSPNNILTTADLDECHGITSQISMDGKNVTTYHYVMTEDFPYSVSCFRGTAIQPPGQPTGGPANANNRPASPTL